MLNNNLDHWA